MTISEPSLTSPPATTPPTPTAIRSAYGQPLLTPSPIQSISHAPFASPTLAPPHWAPPCTHTECTLHQLSPYIGKIKSIIARDLIVRYTKPGDLVADMYCGSGTVPLEAILHGRRIFASDISKYAITLTNAKLRAPALLSDSLRDLDRLLNHAKTLPDPDLRSVPKWVRDFFHPRTLKETLRFTQLLTQERSHFLLACTLGILHHQRPGFLSYPSSHLVPYLRSIKYPRSTYPELYTYRPLAPRLSAKVARALARAPNRDLSLLVDAVHESPAESVKLPSNLNCVITSPPYMNALDYQRDNRLRLWFLGEPLKNISDSAVSTLAAFRRSTIAIAKQLQAKIRPGGHCIFVIADRTARTGDRFPSQELMDIVTSHAPSLALHELIVDNIPDIRRSRRNLTGVKTEHILVYKRNS